MMKFTVDREMMIASLERVASAVPEKSTLPVLSNVLIKAGEQLTLTTYNLELRMEKMVPCSIQQTGATTVPHGLLLDVLSADCAKTIKFELDADELWLEGYGEFCLSTIPAEEYPAECVWLNGPVLRLPAWQLMNAASRVITAASTNGDRPALMGTEWRVDDGGMKMVATNGFRLHQHYCPLSEPAGESFTKLVPAHCLQQALTFFDETDTLDVTFMTVAKTELMQIKSKWSSVEMELIGESFPVWQSIIPREMREVRLEKRIVKEAARLVYALSSRFPPNHNIRFLRTDTGFWLSANGNDGTGSGRSFCPAHGEVPDWDDVTVNGRHFLDVIDVCPSSDIRLCRNVNPTAPIVFKSENDDWLAVLMSVHVGRK